jgi:hypothetical protein
MMRPGFVRPDDPTLHQDSHAYGNGVEKGEKPLTIPNATGKAADRHPRSADHALLD